MITVNSDKGLVVIETWEQVFERPGFEVDLHPEQVQLDRIIGSYIFEDHKPCGLRPCRQPHGRGYLVATKDGRETNLGKDCGKTHFGVDFETLRKTFDRDLLKTKRRAHLGKVINRIPHYLDILSGLRSGSLGANWIHATTRPLLMKRKGVPDDVVEAISRMIRSRNPQIARQRVATDDEIETLEVIEGKTLHRPHYISQAIGSLQGLSALYPENDMRQLLVVDLAGKLEQLRSLNVDTMRDSDLANWDRWAAQIDRKIDNVRNAIVDGKQLLKKENLQQLAEVLNGKNAKKEFAQYCRNLPD
jgi:hypothetical protein